MRGGEVGRWGGTNYDEGTNMENSATTPTQGDTPGNLEIGNGV